MTDGRELTDIVIQAIINVHKELGPGFPESIYRNALMVELSKRGLHAEADKEIVINYDGHVVGWQRLDTLVDNQLILEVKTGEQLGEAHHAQLRSYLTAGDKPLGLLVNFSPEKADFRRVETS